MGGEGRERRVILPIDQGDLHRIDAPARPRHAAKGQVLARRCARAVVSCRFDGELEVRDAIGRAGVTRERHVPVLSRQAPPCGSTLLSEALKSLRLSSLGKRVTCTRRSRESSLD